MRYGTFILALGVLWSSQVSAGELQSVYVAPGGVYPDLRVAWRHVLRAPRIRSGLCATAANIQSAGIL